MLSLETLLRKLVAIPSVSGREGEIAIFIARFCRDRGYEVWLVNGSVAVRIRGTERSRALIFNGHLDTVPGDMPGVLHMKLREDRLEGLGVTDMKSGLAVMLMKAQLYQITPPPCDVWLFFSREEETTAQGSLDLAAWWIRKFGDSYVKKAVLILEPTGNAFVAFSHKGGGVFRAMVAGQGTRHGAVNLVDQETALDRVCRFGASLKRRQRDWLTRYRDIRYGPATINMTRVHTGNHWANVVPNEVEISVDIRTNGTLDLSSLRREFRRFRRRYGVELNLNGREQDISVVECANSSSLRDAFRAGWAGLPEGTFPAATDMNAFLWVGLPVGIVGPGNESLHQQDEYIPRGAMEYTLESLISVTRAFASL